MKGLRAVARLILVLATFTCAAFAPGRAAADGPPQDAAFALIIGSNASVDSELAPLKYADDDAARYHDLFRLLGHRTYLLTRLDDNTRRLHPAAAAEARAPRRPELDRAVGRLAADVREAQARGVSTVVYVIYAGHGNVRDGRGYVTLEDARLSGADLAELVAKVSATRVHVIVDACSSFYLAYERGPGGERRSLPGFHEASGLAALRNVGLLLSTSSARESHEWEAFEGGVFSHEVRSGLYGAADADGDGRVSYREIAAFISRANAKVPSERFRPDVHARPPSVSDTLLDLRPAMARRLELDGRHAGHYYIEDQNGIRVADVHNSPGHAVRLVRPRSEEPVYLRRVDDKSDREFVIPASPDVVALADLQSGPARVFTRGAAHAAFQELFALPFGPDVVASYPKPEASARLEGRPAVERSSSARIRRIVGLSGIGLGATGIAAGASLLVLAGVTAKGLSPEESQVDVDERNQRVRTLQTGGAVAIAGGAAVLAAGVLTWVWPVARHVRAAASGQGLALGYETKF